MGRPRPPLQLFRVSGTTNEVACGKPWTGPGSVGMGLGFELARGRELFDEVLKAMEFSSASGKGDRLGSGDFVHDCWITGEC